MTAPLTQPITQMTPPEVRQALLDLATERLVLTQKLEVVQRTVENLRGRLQATIVPDLATHRRRELQDYGRAKNRLQAALGALNAREKILNRVEADLRRETDAGRFIAAAKTLLDPATYQALWHYVRPDYVPPTWAADDAAPYRGG